MKGINLIPPLRDNRAFILSLALAVFASGLALGMAVGRIHARYGATTILMEIALLLVFAAAVLFVDRCYFLRYSPLLNERKMLRALIDNVPDFMCVKDTGRRFVLANAQLARAAGVNTPDELLGKTQSGLFPGKLAEALQEDEQKIFRSGQPSHNREEKCVDSAGNEIHLLTTRVPLRDSSGQITGIASVGRDISERKKVEGALWEAERRFHGIFDNAIIGIFQSTPAGRLIRVNPAMAVTFGYASAGEMMRLLTDFARQCFVDSKRGEEYLHLMETPGEAQNFECEVFRKDGSKIWLTLSVRAIRQNGVAIRHEGMCEDVTERKMLRSQLLQAQKLESVGQLAAGIAHEINTPTQYIGDNVRFLKDAFQDMTRLLESYQRLLTAAKGNALCSETIQSVGEAVEGVDTDFLLEEIPKAFEHALDGVQRVSTIANAMKEFSHPDRKEKVPQDINRAIRTTIAVTRNEWKYVAEMVTEFDSTLPLVLCLPGEFNQVILNLIVNAAHAIADVVQRGGTEKGTIRVLTIHCAEWAEIRIQDTGTGIPEAVRTRVFDPFFTTKEVGKGTGQGLAIARSIIVEKHGGSISFETEEGKGTTFIIRLPLDDKSPDVRRVNA